MNLETQFDLNRRQAEQRREEALQAWQRDNALLATSDTHQIAFLAGYDTAAGPLPPTGKEVVAERAKQIAEEAEQERRRLSALPPGTCPECEGEGEFVGATHITKCVTCGGTGRVQEKGGSA